MRYIRYKRLAFLLVDLVISAILLSAGIWLIEGLNLSAVKPGAYELVCLPLRITGAVGAPARAILRPLNR